MAISIDTVYQRVLALANKEQRGYITPQEFNLLANQAQMEIFEQYFYDAKSEDGNLKNSTEFSNVDEILDEKISIFKMTTTLNVNNSIATVPANLHRLGMVYTTDNIEVEQLTEEEVLYLNQSPIAKPSNLFPAYVRNGNISIQVHPAMVSGFVNCNYVRTPANPKWGYIVVAEQALYNNSNTVDFELHRSDEAELVYRILSLAGIVIAKPGLGTYSDQQATTQKTQEKQ